MADAQEDWGVLGRAARRGRSRPRVLPAQCATFDDRRAFVACAAVVFPACQLTLALVALVDVGRREDACALRCLAVVALGCAACVAGLAVSAPQLENPSLLLACALSSLPPLARSWRCGTLSGAPALDRGLLATSGLVEVIVVILAVRVWRGFGWRVYKVVGGDIALNRAYANYQALQASVVVTCELWAVALFMAYAAACVSSSDAIGLTLACVALGAFEVLAVRRESSALVVAALLAHAALACYAVVLVATGLRRGTGGSAGVSERAQCGAPAWLCAHAHDGSVHVLRELTVAACVLAPCAQALVCALCAHATSAFGRGLRERAFARGKRGKRGARARFAIDQPFTNFIQDDGSAHEEPQAIGRATGSFLDGDVESVPADLSATGERDAPTAAGGPVVEPLVAPRPSWPPSDLADDADDGEPPDPAAAGGVAADDHGSDGSSS